MRAVVLVLIATAGLSAGCSLMIARSGKDLDKVTTREQARAELGRLVESGEKDGRAYDLFHYHGKVRVDWAEGTAMGMGWAMMFGMTFGLVELVCLPQEMYKLARGLVIGQDIEVSYDQAGKVTGFQVGGRTWSGPPVHQDDESQSASPDLSPPAALK